MKRIFRILAITIFALAVPVLMFAQTNLRHPNNGNPPQIGNPNNPPVGGQPGAPIDGGLGVLLTLALAFGAKELHGLKKKREE
jgi:hypothetical protein